METEMRSKEWHFSNILCDEQMCLSWSKDLEVNTAAY